MSSSASEGPLKQAHMCRTNVLKLSQEIIKYSEQCCSNSPTKIIFKKSESLHAGQELSPALLKFPFVSF